MKNSDSVISLFSHEDLSKDIPLEVGPFEEIVVKEDVVVNEDVKEDVKEDIVKYDIMRNILVSDIPKLKRDLDDMRLRCRYFESEINKLWLSIRVIMMSSFLFVVIIKNK